MTDEIQSAYDRLADADLGHPSLADGLGASLRRRRRRRAALVVAGAAVLVAGAGGIVAAATTGNEGRTTTPVAVDPTSPAPTTDASTSAPVLPRALECADDLRQGGTFDFLPPPSGASAAEAAAEFAHGDRVVVEGRSAWLLRGDGSAYAQLTLIGDPGSGFQVETTMSCAGESTMTRRTEVTLDVGHCWIEPLRVHDGNWLPLLADQRYGTGGTPPRDFTGTGDVRWWSTTHDRLEYVDARGARLDLYPASDPRTDTFPCT